ncbi:helicase-exonuclease AddAB subunit AddA [Turicibacter sp. TJ11]|uniref:helicase-exonuclease AddAB subunit AddA n=1 Tax=Turicibacter sp. TJ11 TaxID=2806443 RepID=UPI001F37D208|nr:helicase-exonuclease AddAB subunit AddA [Turicibacter sp. TJ11]
MSSNSIPKKPSEAIWNDEQWQAIYEKGHDLLISAGAGSGKTAVLVERIIQKILIDQIQVDELLVLTFTEAAAAEMKQRIRSRIEQELGTQPDNLLLSAQLNKISSANISTFHAFCNKLIRRYYYLLQLDPVFKIADDIEVGILQDDVIESLFDDLAEADDEEFLRLTDIFNSDRDDEALKVMLLKVYELARSNPNMINWLMNLSSLYEWDGQDLKSWCYYDEIKKLMLPSIEEALVDLEKARQFAIDSEMMGTPHKYPTDVYPEDLAYVTRLKESHQSSYDELRQAFKNTKLSTFPRLNKKQFDEVAHGQSKDARDLFKKRLTKLEEKYFVYSNETHARHFSESIETVNALSHLVLKFHERFTKAKRERQLLDFSDLEWNTLALLVEDDQPTEVAVDIYQQFKEIMIDEYQDTNSMQECIISSIAKVKNPEIPIFMVGDVKQSIYRFRLAEPSIFQGKYQRFAKDQTVGNKIDLMKNYRSHQQVIDATNFIFKQLMDEPVGEIEYDEAAMLKLGVDQEVNDAFNQSEIHLLDKKQFEEEGDTDLNAIEIEAHHIARLILQWIASDQQIYDRKKGVHRSITYQDIVILMRSLSSVAIFQDVFRLYQIPLFTEQTTDLFDSIEIINLISCLKVIDNPYQDIPLVGLMRSPMFFFTERELSLIKVATKAQSFYELVRYYQAYGEDEGLKEKVTAFVQTIERWRFQSKTTSLSQLITRIYEQTLYYEFVLGLPHGYLRKANLDVFVDKARIYESSTKKGLYGFINYIDRMQALGKHFGKAKTVTANENVVRIMSIHKSKGLEFPIVFVSQIHKKFNEQDEKGNYLVHKKYGVAVKYIDPVLRLKQKTIVQNVVGSMIHKEMLAEEMRLLYVAMTRAKSKLIFTGVFDTDKKLASMSEVIKESQWMLPSSHRLNAKNYADWIIPAVLKHKDSKEIVQTYCDRQAYLLDDESSWQLRVITEHEQLQEQSSKSEQQTMDPPKLDFEKIFYQTYEYQPLVEINAKQSVSQRKEEESTPIFKVIPEVKPQVAYDRPSFMKENQVSGPEAGTALHQFMQHLPLSLNHTTESLQELKERIIEKEMMTEAMANKINFEQVLAFTKTPLYETITKANMVKKEVPFMTLVKIADHEQSQILLQGVIDLLAEFDDEVFIIDYKTDYVFNFESQYNELKERYAVQMKYYSKAIKEIYPTKKVSCYVYFLKVQQSIIYE